MWQQDSSVYTFIVCQLDGCATYEEGTLLGLKIHFNGKRIEISLSEQGMY